MSDNTASQPRFNLDLSNSLVPFDWGGGLQETSSNNIKFGVDSGRIPSGQRSAQRLTPLASKSPSMTNRESVAERKAIDSFRAEVEAVRSLK